MTRTIVITGASDGIGAAAARNLHQSGHRIVVVGRSPEKTKAVAREFGADHLVADFARLDDVRRLAADLEKLCPRIDVLANNAGGIFTEQAKTVDGNEKNFQINYLAPFLLTNLLIERLIESKASLIQTSSVAARMLGKLDLDDLEHDKRFSPMRAYGTAKLGNILFTRELHRRFHSQGLSTAAFHPGAVASSFGSASKGFISYLTTSSLIRTFMVTPQKGAEQLVWLADSTPGVDWVSGQYYEKGEPARRNNPQVPDDELACRLWYRSERLLGLTPSIVPAL